MKYFPPTELALNAKGEVYHLGLLPEQLAEKIILVGDQDRVALVTSFFDNIEFTSRHREFVCQTGTYKGKRITVLSTGIGTDNIDITINELDALVNIDLKSRTEKTEKVQLELVRIGTCGILQSSIPLHSHIISDYAFGLDNVAHFYEIEFSEKEQFLASELSSFIGLPKTIQPYAVAADETLSFRLQTPQTFSGITVTSSGFYGPQGRQLRIPTRTADIQLKFGEFNMNGLMVCNFEMESSALFSLGKALGHRCATICLGVANRPNQIFSQGYNTEMLGLIENVLNQV
ncbi:MAG: nucleoside phosphorylase [Flavobacteriia bacterium]|nr:nucleoside phosphorylase [Flavobacteriia bacterium]